MALLYKYSEGKSNNTESTGRFGTGFLTTHSLSKVVQMEGPIIDEDGAICEFEVTMYRDGKNNEELIEGMKKMEEEKKFWRNKNPRWTKFKYLLKTKRNKESSELGAMNFQNNIILTMLFNQKFKRVTLNYKDINLIYEKIENNRETKVNDVEIISYTLQDIHTKEKKARSYLHSKLYEYSKELSEHYDKERYLLVECALEIDKEQKNIIYDEKSPCLFCSLPLVGSENHILPFILNSNDFEPSTERQEILLDGADIKKDEKRNKEIPTDVGINKYILKRTYILFENIIKYCSDNKFNNLHLLARGLKDVPKVNRYFDKKWYEDNYMLDMRNILLKYPIIYNTQGELCCIKDIFFPIYDVYDDEKYMKTFYYLIKELFINVPRYKESINWSKYLWEKDLEKNRISINKLIAKYNESNHDFEFNNCFIKFIWDYYRKLTINNKILINQENNYVLYDEKEFVQSNDVSEDMINCIEELGHPWRINHLNKNITSIELPIKHDSNYAVNIIKKIIENDKEKSFLLCRYVEKDNDKRENIYHLSKLLFGNKIGEKYIVENFQEDIWKSSDEYIIDKMVQIAEKWRNLNNINITIEDYNKFLNFLLENNNKIFDEIKLLPSINGEFNFLKNLKEEIGINEEIKEAAKKYINLYYDSRILNKGIIINNLNISKYCMDDLFKEINQFLNEKDFSKNKIDLSIILINYIPNLESNHANDEILKKHNDIRYIYSSICKKTLKENLIQTQFNSIWASIDEYIMIHTQKKLQSMEKIDDNFDVNNYIKVLNEYQSYFDFHKYDIIPNSYKRFLNINYAEDYNDIPDDILTAIKNVFNKDLKKQSVLKGLNIKGIAKKSIKDIGEIIEICFEDFKKSHYIFDYISTYELCKTIIKYIPKSSRIKEYQIKLYNLYKLFNKNIGDQIEIDSNENLYHEINEGIIQFINEGISDCKTVKNTKRFTDDIFQLINENTDILNPVKYSIMPNQLGELKKLENLYRDDNIFEELKDVLSDYFNIRKKLIDKRIKEFPTNKILSNENLKTKINNLILENANFDIRKTLGLIPKKECDEKQKQKDLIYIYEKILNKKQKINVKEIELEPSFWNTTNEYCLRKFKEFFYNNKINKKLHLLDIDDNEEEALRILETLYKYIPPELQINGSLKLIPNQYGLLLPYNDISEEKNLNQNFKEMLKKYFNYDISFYLKHKNLKYSINKKLTINEEIIEIINDGFISRFLNTNELKIISNELIKFYPTNKEEDNYVLKFISCYKSLTNKDFREEEINTNNINLWDKAIKALLTDILDLIHSDKTLKKTVERVHLDEDTTIKKLNIFYSLLFKMYPINNIKKDLCYIPNENGIYKKLNNIFINLDIDDEIKEVLSLINEEKSFDHILLHHKVKLDIQHNQKKLEDIICINDKEIKYIYNQIDQKNKNNEINDNFKKACKLLINKWLKDHRDKIELFEFVNGHLVDIYTNILFDKETKKLLDELLIAEPEALIDMIKFQCDPNAPFFFEDSIIEDSVESSFDATRDNSISDNLLFNIGNIGFNNDNDIINNNNVINDNNIINNNNNNNNNINNNYNINHLRNNIQRRRIYPRLVNNNYQYHNYNNYYIDLTRRRYEEGLKKYCLAQALVYEKLLESNIFSEINWINKLTENQEGEVVLLRNGHRYKVKKEVSDFEFKVKTNNQNKEYKIKVKRGDNSRRYYLKYNFNNSEWNLFKNESQSVIFAFVNLKYENQPEILFNKTLKLDEL